ncbi:MAG TPA: choice-of-anchor Q domain-containing protein, partial [Mycobacteriales bacterium]|nr:choice-of-anchor Q domain-containing protein [Mycobacteriales bacterium]
GADATGIATFGESATVHHSTFALDISASGDSGNSNATGVESGALGGSLDVTNSKFTGTTDVPGSDLESIDCEQDAASCSVATTHMSVTAETETGSTADDTEAIATDITSDAGFLTVSKSQLSADALEVPLDPGANLAGAIFITANGAVSHSTLLASGAATGLEVDGISTVSPADSPVVSMTDSTVVGDSSSSTGIAVNEYIDNTNTGALTPAVLTVEQSTITSVAGGPAGVGIFVDDQGTANLGADILAANDDNCELGGTGSYVDEGYDIDSDTTCTSAPTSVSGSTTIAGSLTPLANNGGPTETVGLKAGSPAIGLVSGTFHLTTDASQACANDDQRGHARAASGCDAGAFEGTVSPSGSGSGSGAQTPTVTVTSSDPTSADGQPVTYTATISPAPSCGSVAWLVDGVAQGTAVAVSSGTVGPDGLTITFGPVSDLDVGTHPVTAAYSGCAGISQAAGTVVQVVGEGSTTGTSGTGPTITAKVTSKHHKTKAGWYRDPVTVTFTCTPAAAPLAAPGCPPPVTLKNSAAGQSVTGSVTATDGGIATVTVSPINIDRTPPTGLRLHGATAGHRYSFAHRHRQLTCSAHDSLSGVRSCTVSRTHVTHVHVVVVHYTLTATNKAGDATKATGTYRYSRNA